MIDTSIYCTVWRQIPRSYRLIMGTAAMEVHMYVRDHDLRHESNHRNCKSDRIKQQLKVML